jgi:hypothetical protein
MPYRRKFIRNVALGSGDLFLGAESFGHFVIGKNQQ